MADMSGNNPRPGATGLELRDGWLTVTQPDGSGLHVRLSNQGGRQVITDLYLHGKDIDSSALRAINTTKIHAIARAFREDIEADAASIADYAAEQRLDEPTMPDLRRRVSTAQPRQARPRTRVTRPAGIDPDVFYSRVADAYRDYAATTGRAAAAAIAAEAGAPPSAAHRWIREARRRGFLPAGTRGRTG